jgi:putative endonuclease
MRISYLDQGKKGEKLANEYLIGKGYGVLDINYFFKTETGRKIGEIDIIAKKGNVYVFIEVKTTVNHPNIDDYFRLERRVDKKKSDKIIITAQKWFLDKKIKTSNLKWQLDIIGVIISDTNDEDYKIIHLENVFEDKEF